MRSSRPDVRNPVLALPGARRIASLSPEAREALAEIMADIGADARARAQESWRKNKGPMAAYWKAVGAYAGHIRRALRGTAHG
ncbi:hypothetical protein [Chelatococcus reniformis]|uniref:Uncharacterized protein n=1 Tax=Chelatococcus reniformis TaxID=1494448 RepID=A0A916UWW2_9HYPH|nr:hypothetical protein [Chelatococcus reniformis]GGC90743.1 hypothetical protein GCM10010994_55680 [Chelatococcus reniformis]